MTRARAFRGWLDVPEGLEWVCLRRGLPQGGRVLGERRPGPAPLPRDCEVV